MQNLTADSPIEAAGVSIPRLYKPVIYEEPRFYSISGGVLFCSDIIVHNEYSSRQTLHVVAYRSLRMLSPTSSFLSDHWVTVRETGSGLGNGCQVG